MNGRGGLAIAVVAALIVGFSLGLVAGITFMRFGPPVHAPFGLAVAPDGAPAPGPGAPLMGPGHRMNPGPMLRRLVHELDLTDVQQARIHQILERAHSQQAATRDSTHAAIERELTPAQRARWRELELRFQTTWRGRSGHPLPEHGRPTGGDPEPGEER
jgi:hypothetical protein